MYGNRNIVEGVGNDWLGDNMDWINYKIRGRTEG